MVVIRNGTRPMKVGGGRLNCLQTPLLVSGSQPCCSQPSAASQAGAVRGGDGSWVELVDAACSLPRLE